MVICWPRKSLVPCFIGTSWQPGTATMTWKKSQDGLFPNCEGHLFFPFSLEIDWGGVGILSNHHHVINTIGDFRRKPNTDGV